MAPVPSTSLISTADPASDHHRAAPQLALLRRRTGTRRSKLTNYTFEKHEDATRRSLAYCQPKNCAGNDSGSGTSGASGDSGDPPGQCEDWDPDGLVAFNRKTRAYEVDQQLIDDLQQKPTLLSCDGSKSVLQSGGFYMLEGLGRDDLASHLGLRDRDIIKSLNGWDLRYPDDYFSAFAALADQTSFTLTVDRDGVDVVLTFVVV